MRRRDFIILLGGVAVTRPLAARAQRDAPTVGYLQGGSPEGGAINLAAFRKGLSEMGYVEGRNLTIEYRYAQNRLERLPELAMDLAQRGVAVIATPGSDAATAAAKAATSSIPIVFEMGGDPVQEGLVASLNHPGGNLTGVTSMNAELSAKRLGILRDLLPRAQRFAALVNRDSPATKVLIDAMQAAAARVQVEVKFYHASTVVEIDAAFARLVQNKTEALVGGNGPPFNDRVVQVVSLATRHALPAIFGSRDYTGAGGLMSYAASPDRFRQVGIYVGRIIKGERPADLPVMLPTKFELVLNLKTATTLGLEIPPTLLALADEVIE